MRRRDFVTGGLVAFGAGVASAQTQRGLPQILLIGPAWSEPSESWATFLNELQRLGYNEGKNISVRRHIPKLSHPEWSELLGEFKRNPPHVIVASSYSWARSLRATVTSIPIVVSALSPVEHGLFTNLARPATNITGVAVDTGPDFLGKQLELMLQALPGASKLACLAAEALYPGMRQFWSQANQRGVSVHEVFVIDKYEPIFAGLARDEASAVLVLAEPYHLLNAQSIADASLQHRLPVISPFRRLTELGGLMSYGIDWHDLDRQLAGYAVRLLRGAKPSEMPVGQPTRFELVLNRKTALKFGIQFPQTLTLSADEFIE